MQNLSENFKTPNITFVEMIYIFQQRHCEDHSSQAEQPKDEPGGTSVPLVRKQTAESVKGAKNGVRTALIEGVGERRDVHGRAAIAPRIVKFVLDSLIRAIDRGLVNSRTGIAVENRNLRVQNLKVLIFVWICAVCIDLDLSEAILKFFFKDIIYIISIV